jgi:hypothetical protein
VNSLVVRQSLEDSLEIMICNLLTEIHAQLDQILVNGFVAIIIANIVQCLSQSIASGLLRPRQIIFDDLEILNDIEMSKLFFKSLEGQNNSLSPRDDSTENPTQPASGCHLYRMLQSLGEHQLYIENQTVQFLI